MSGLGPGTPGQPGAAEGPAWPAPPPVWPTFAPAPSTATPGYWFDAESGLMLPEGTQLAGYGRRIGAYFLAIPLSIFTLGVGYLIWGLVVWARGQTPTYQVLGMRCWRPQSGQVAGWWWMALREVLGSLVESLFGVITELISFVAFLATRQRQTLHDMVAGTVVLYDPNKVLR